MKGLELNVTKQNGMTLVQYNLGAADVYDDRVIDKVASLDNIITFQYKDEDGKRSVTSYVHDEPTLEVTLKRQLKKSEALAIIRGLLYAFEVGAAGVPVGYLVRDTNYIYVNPETFAVKCILVPVKGDALNQAEVPCFFRNVVSRMRFDDGDKDNYVAKVLTMINSDEYSNMKLKDLVDKELEAIGVFVTRENGIAQMASSQSPAGAPKDVRVSRVGVMNSMRPQGQQPMMGQQPPMMGQQPPMMGQQPPMMGQQPPMMGQQPPMMGQQPPMMGQQPPMMGQRPPMMGQQPPMMGQRPPMMGQQPPMMGQQPPMMGQQPPMMGQQPPMMGQQPPQPAMPEAPKPQPAMPEAPKPQPVMPEAPKPQPAMPETPKPQAPQPAMTGMPLMANSALPLGGDSPAGSGVTGMGQLVGQLGTKPVPHMIRKSTGEIIYITKPQFVIGKSKTKADYSLDNNTAISREHCIIVQRDGVNYIKDNNSTNHTYVNGAELQPGKEVLLKHKTEIRLGDEEFTFLLRKGE